MLLLGGCAGVVRIPLIFWKETGNESASIVAVRVIAFRVWEQHMACSDAVEILADIEIETEGFPAYGGSSTRRWAS